MSYSSQDIWDNPKKLFVKVNKIDIDVNIVAYLRNIIRYKRCVLCEVETVF
jgi:hypothetical protein